jgi:hypothetical protein
MRRSRPDPRSPFSLVESRCSARILKASEEECRRLIERFRELNGAEWRGAHGPDPEINALYRSVAWARRDEWGATGRTREPEDEERVREFVCRNAELLRLTDAEVRGRSEITSRS